MSDPDAKPDPMDKAYAEAEALLNDERERAERRARVLAAVASEPAAAPEAASRSTGRGAWARGGWLVAAGVAGFSVLLATQVYLPSLKRPQPELAAPAVTAPAAGVEVVPKAAAPAPAQRAAPAASAVAAQATAPVSRAVPPPPAQFAPAAPAPPPPPPAEPAADSVQELVVTGQRIPAGDAQAVERRAPAPASKALAAPADLAARLHAAAAAGRTDDLAALLADGAPVDAVDAEGETALMKSIQANRPAAAALLRRRGASLDRQNQAGVSAREMARRLDDAELNHALGID
jgi:hypothetical protein